MTNSKRCWILDPGHGGIDPATGKYVTAGKRSPAVPPGIFEGVFNREVVDEISEWLNEYRIRHEITAPGWEDIPLKDRVKRVKDIIKARGNCILISIHANAAPGVGWSSANGTVVFTRRQFKAEEDMLADSISKRMDIHTPMNSRGVKRANFTMVVVPCPAVLVECGFMTNKKDAEYLASPAGVREVAGVVVRSIIEWEAVEQ